MADDTGDREDLSFSALQALLVYAVDPISCGGLHLCGMPGPGRDAVLRAVHRVHRPHAPVVKVPCHIADERLLGGMDLAATLAAGKPVVARGVLASADTGAAVFAMAERLPRRTVAHIVNAMDSGYVQLERDGFSDAVPARFSTVALDESLGDDEALNPALADRLAFCLWTDHLNPEDVDELPLSPDELQHAREGLSAVRLSDAVLQAVCHTALGLGVLSMRSVMQTVHAAKVLAALSGSLDVEDEQASAAVRLVLAHRAMQLPPVAPEDAAPPPDSAEPEEEQATSRDSTEPQKLDDVLIDAALAAIPPGLLDQLARDRSRLKLAKAGRSGAKMRALNRGRPIGDKPATRSDARLNVLATLKAAAPWQRLRASEPGRLNIQRDDFRETRRKSRTRTTNIFVVDASGSSAAQRLGEVKGAVELLLADCYVRRDQVALIGFRGEAAELLLPPTRSLVRAKRELSSLPGGGATPLANAIDVARDLAENLRRQGQRPVVILMTDGRGNVGRDGTPGHPDCQSHTEDAAAELAQSGVQSLLVDVSRRPRERGRRLAHKMGGRYMPLPFANAEAISATVKAAGAG